VRLGVCGKGGTLELGAGGPKELRRLATQAGVEPRACRQLASTGISALLSHTKAAVCKRPSARVGRPQSTSYLFTLLNLKSERTTVRRLATPGFRCPRESRRLESLVDELSVINQRLHQRIFIRHFVVGGAFSLRSTQRV